ncbi:MAG: hypothetical protein IT320_15125 [Anaerolineae bacterium]|nr:hypothetical protein [Anaerolineae bacterium]
MMHDVVLAIFPSRSTLTKALDHLIHSSEIEIERAAVLTKADSGELVVVDDEIGPEEGGVAGGTFGAALAALGMVQLGALALPGVGPILAIGVGVLAGGVLGNLTGRFAANLHESGFEQAHIELLTDRLQMGHPALLLDIRDANKNIAQLRKTLASYNAEVVERVPVTASV